MDHNMQSLVLSSVWENDEGNSFWSSGGVTVWEDLASSEEDTMIGRLAGSSQLSTVESSVSSSECGSDDLYNDTAADLESNLLRLSENLTSPLFYGCDDNESVFTADGIDLSDSEIDPGSEYNIGTDAASEVVIPSVSCTPDSSPVLQRRQLSSSTGSLFDSNIPAWNDMSHVEQLSVVQDLTEVVSHQLGLREQLDVISIINPTADVSPTDTEFVIELERLDDTKLHEVCEYIRQLRHSLSEQTDRSRSHLTSDTCSECSSSGLTPTKNTPRKKQQRRQVKESRLRQKKDRRQERKEKRSGLFEKEEVLALQMPEQSAEVDIDILT